jgi:hypothetical protein
VDRRADLAMLMNGQRHPFIELAAALLQGGMVRNTFVRLDDYETIRR